VAALIEQRDRLRHEEAPAEVVVVVRGGRDSIDKLRRHALRTARAWSLDGVPLLGISVFAVVDRPLETLLRERFATFRTVHVTTAGHLRVTPDSSCCLPACGHISPSACAARTTANCTGCWLRSARCGTIPITVSSRHGEGRSEMYRVDISADLNDEDDTGYVWTLLDEARDPARIVAGALVVAGDEDAAAICQVVDLVPAGDGTIVHLRMLPGLVEDYLALAQRLAG
jgi:hypothetical protein